MINNKGEAMQVVERTNSWHTRGFKKRLVCTERRARAIDAMISFASSVIVLLRLIREVWNTLSWDARPDGSPDDQSLLADFLN